MYFKLSGIVRLFFNILHPPLNVPALAVSLDKDVDTNKELVAHGYSNLIVGLFGSVYEPFFRLEIIGANCLQPKLPRLCEYTAVSNTWSPIGSDSTLTRFISFYRVGGTTRVSGLLLAAATVLLLVGTSPIGYIREYFIAIVGISRW